MYNEWKFYIKGRSINSLYLDELNIRTPIADKALSQADLIEELVENDKIFELAKIIERLGYFPSEGPIIMPRASKGGTYTVLEGNRRVTAVKLILDPDKAPRGWKAKFQKLHDKANLTNLKKIPVWIVPTRASAEICIAMKHAPPEGGALESWTPIQQAAFYDRHKKEGLSIDKIAAEYHTTAKIVSGRLRFYALYEMGRRISLSVTARKYWNPRHFPVSVLDRIISNPDARKALGLTANDEGGWNIADQKWFMRIYECVLEKIAAGEYDTRSLDRDGVSPVIKDLASELKKAGAKKGGKGTTSDKVVSNTQEVEEGGGAPPAKKAAKKAATKRAQRKVGNGLFSVKLLSHLDSPRLQEILTELQEAKIPAQKNAAALLLRTSLELSARAWLCSKGRKQQWSAMMKDATDAEKQLGPKLSRMLKFLRIKCKVDLDLEPADYKALAGLDGKTGDGDILNQYVHSKTYKVTQDKLTEVCSRLEPLLRRLLEG